jgi:hypothetical protein
MTHLACLPVRFSWLALMSAVVVLFAWAAPADYAITGDLCGHSQPVNDLAAEQSETTDDTDDPVALFLSSHLDLYSLTLSLRSAHLVRQIWSPTPPVRPPIVLISI